MPAELDGVDLDRAIAEIQARADAATSGPWILCEPGHAINETVSVCNGMVAPRGWSDPDVLDNEDAAFIAHAREDVPYLLVALAAARATLRALEAMKNDE